MYRAGKALALTPPAHLPHSASHCSNTQYNNQRHRKSERMNSTRIRAPPNANASRDPTYTQDWKKKQHWRYVPHRRRSEARARLFVSCVFHSHILRRSWSQPTPRHQPLLGSDPGIIHFYLQVQVSVAAVNFELSIP